jgi:trimeric autotransporter adhesin
MKKHRLPVITSLVLVALIIATGVVFAQDTGAVNQGTDSTAGGDFSTVSGGKNNNIPEGADFATIGGGRDNIASGEASTVGGGDNNQAQGTSAAVSGGHNNIAFSPYVTVGGGHENDAAGTGSVIGGGFNHLTSDTRYATIGGGFENSIQGGDPREAFAATIPGGRDNEANAPYSFAAGRRATVKGDHDGAILFADSRNVDFNSRAANEFAVRATGGVRFVSAIRANGAPRAGVRLDRGDNQWRALSDRNAKENFVAVDGRDILERLASIPLETWNYKTQDPSIRHIGPMAQDFHAAFKVGTDDKHIGTVDADGVALAAIQGLYEVVQEKDAQIAAQQQQIAALQEHNHQLEARMVALEESVRAEAQGVQTGLLPFSASVMWMLVGGLGLVLVTPGLVLGYRRIRRDE